MSRPVVCTTPLTGVRVITLSRPDQLNTLNAELVDALHRELDEAAADRGCRVVILTGAGRAFCAGLDLNGFGDGDRIDTMGRTLGTLDRQRVIARLVEKIHLLPQPVIAAINGPAAGAGLAMACASDIRIAADDAVFAVGFIRAGFSACDIGLSWLLPRIIGTGAAHELMLTGRRFDAGEARRSGLLSRTVPPEDLMDTVLTTVDQILANPPASIELTKQGMWLAMEMPSLHAAIQLENRQQVITALTDDQAEAANAFLAKRAPVYRHR